jgi:hypothetical protein
VYPPEVFCIYNNGSASVVTKPTPPTANLYPYPSEDYTELEQKLPIIDFISFIPGESEEDD